MEGGTIDTLLVWMPEIIVNTIHIAIDADQKHIIFVTAHIAEL